MRSSRKPLCPAASDSSDNQLLRKPKGPSSVSLLAWQHLALLKNTFSKDRISPASPRSWYTSALRLLHSPFQAYWLPPAQSCPGRPLSFQTGACISCSFSFRTSHDSPGKDHPRTSLLPLSCFAFSPGVWLLVHFPDCHTSSMRPETGPCVHTRAGTMSVRVCLQNKYDNGGEFLSGTVLLLSSVLMDTFK